VDINFWRSSKESNASEQTVLFIGNDLNRDFELAIKIAQEIKNVKFKFVTSMINEQDVPENVELIRGDWRNAFLSDIEVRNIYYESSVVIIPLKDSLQPSGQSVALQAMACGKPVLITRTEGFWDPESYINMKHCVFIKLNNLEDWCCQIINLVGDRELYNTLAINGRQLVEEKYSADLFSKRLEDLILSI